jgi:hypothetical protein
MKTHRILFIIALTFNLVATCPAAQNAQARLHCWSLRFSSASATGSGGFAWELDLTTVNSVYNGELAPDRFNTGYTHWSWGDLYYELDEETYPGFLALDVPNAGDANGNGFPDFFEVSQAVNGLATTGVLEIDVPLMI